MIWATIKKFFFGQTDGRKPHRHRISNSSLDFEKKYKKWKFIKLKTFSWLENPINWHTLKIQGRCENKSSSISKVRFFLVFRARIHGSFSVLISILESWKGCQEYFGSGLCYGKWQLSCLRPRIYNMNHRIYSDFKIISAKSFDFPCKKTWRLIDWLFICGIFWIK